MAYTWHIACRSLADQVDAFEVNSRDAQVVKLEIRRLDLFQGARLLDARIAEGDGSRVGQGSAGRPGQPGLPGWT